MTDFRPPTAHGAVVSGVWVGDKVIPLAHACIKSFLRKGHSYNLYVYNEVTGAPAGLNFMDAVGWRQS